MVSGAPQVVSTLRPDVVERTARRPHGFFRGPLRLLDPRVRALSRHRLLSGACRRTDLARIVRGCERVRFGAGAAVVREGQHTMRALYLVVSGTAETRRDGVRVGRFGPGDHFGELALLDAGPQPVTVEAVTDLGVLTVDLRYVLTLLDRSPRLRRRLLETLLSRIADIAVASGRPELLYRPTPTAIERADRRPPARRPRGPWRRRLRRTLAATVVAGLLGVLAVSYEPPVLIVSPGPTIDVLEGVEVTGVPTYRPTGRYLLTSVRFERGNVVDTVVAFLRSGRDVVHAPDRRDEPALNTSFEHSRIVAAAAAAHALGAEVGVSGTGASITSVDPPDVSGLRPDDVIVAIDGRPVRLVSDARAGLAAVRGEAMLTVERGGRTIEVPLHRRDADRLDLRIETRDLDVRLPFEITFPDRRVNGASAGLIFAIAIADLLDPHDLSQGRTIAATGGVSFDGHVHAVSGVVFKASAAGGSDVTLMLVPMANAADVRAGFVHYGTDTVEEALRILGG